MSRNLVIDQTITLDGVVEFTDGFDPFDTGIPAGHPDHDVLRELLTERMTVEQAVLLGRSTFEDFRGYWPGRRDADGIGAHLDAVAKHVVSTTLSDPAWANTTVHAGVEPAVTALRDGDGEIVVTGSITLCRALLAAGLVDELRLTVKPIVLGAGRRLFDRAPRTALDLVDLRSFAGGMSLQTYRVRRAGPGPSASSAGTKPPR